MRRQLIARLMFFFFMLPSSAQAGGPETATLSRIIDGDTVEITQGTKIRVRLFGIDCPEKGQPFGDYATGATAMALTGQVFEVIHHYKDRLGRNVVTIQFEGGGTLQESLLAIGAAWVSPKYCDQPECDKWQQLEANARNKKVGLWTRTMSEPVAPWHWRK